MHDKKIFGDPSAIDKQMGSQCVKSEPVFVTGKKNIFQTSWHEQVNYRGGKKYPSSAYEANIVSNPISKDGKIMRCFNCVVEKTQKTYKKFTQSYLTQNSMLPYWLKRLLEWAYWIVCV